ncbi:TPR domain protein [Beauveria brongniartii RCEF 3172]|uniref:TPR domain protein n=1 Tax=Beauveria brongniartii RCEF 3172 TaxID=1081107 RepID=A0A166X7N3_9HYPO|nr:TPR domain protein [Beauveria brongniartii RCEF 3172]
MSDLLPEAGGQDPAATSLSMQSEFDRAQIASSHLNKTLDILEQHKQKFITDLEHEVKQYFEGLGIRSCFNLVEIEETRDINGSVTARQLDYYEFEIDEDFSAHLSAFMQQHVTNQQPVPVRKLIDSAHTGFVEELVQTQFNRLWERQSADLAACYLKLHLEVASRRVLLCSHARERLRSSETPLTTQQLADVSSLDDDEIVRDVLKLATESERKGASYSLAMEVVERCLPQPNFEWQTKPVEPQATRIRTGPRELRSTTKRSNLLSVARSNLISVARSIVTNQFILFLVDVLGVKTADISISWLSETGRSAKLVSLLEVSPITATLGERIATALANDLRTSFTDQNEKLWKDSVLREDVILQRLVEELISSTDRAKIVNRITDVSPRARKVLETDEHSKVKRCIEEEFYLMSSGRYSWLDELQKLRVSSDDMAELLLDEHDACPWVFYTAVESDESQTDERPLLDHHLNGCAHSLLETGHEGLDSPSRVAAISNTSSSASFQDIETITKLHRICGLAGFSPTSRNKETWSEYVMFEEEEVAVARVSYKTRDSSPATEGKDILERIIAALGGLCTAFEKVQRLDLCCNSYTVFCTQTLDSPPKIEAFRIQISVVWKLLEDLRSVVTKPEYWTGMAFSMLYDESSVLHTALQPLLGSHSGPLLYSEAGPGRREIWLHFCALAAQFLSLAFLSYTQAHKGELFPAFLTEPLRRVGLCGVGMVDGRVIEMATRPLTCIGNMLDSGVICFRLLPSRAIHLGQEYLPNHNIYANLADIVDTWGPAELLCESSDQRPFAMRIGGGILYTEDPNRSQYHWSEAVDLNTVSRKEMDPVGKLLIGAIYVNSGCQSNYGALRGRTRLQTLGTQEQSYRVVFENVGFNLGQLFSLVVQASVKHSAGVSHKKADRDTAQHHVMSLLDYRSAVQVSYCTGICQRVRFRDMVADLLREFGPETVHSKADAEAWRQLLATDIVRHLKGNGDVELDDPMHRELLKQKVKEMFGYLCHSGISNDRTLRVAWPSREDRHAYSPVHCSGTNAWAKLLSESTHISSYAYIAPHCLQADRGSACQSGWEPVTGLSQVRAFATRVQCVNPVKSVAELPHESICFFQLMRIMVFAQVHHPDGEPVILRVILHTVRTSVVRRVIAIWLRTGKTITQVQESRYGATEAEEVLIVCGWDA